MIPHTRTHNLYHVKLVRNLYTQVFSQSVYTSLLAICIRNPSRNLYTQAFSQSVYASLRAICIHKQSRNLYTQAFSQSVYASLLAVCIRKSSQICIRKPSRNLYTQVLPQSICIRKSLNAGIKTESQTETDRQSERQLNSADLTRRMF